MTCETSLVTSKVNVDETYRGQSEWSIQSYPLVGRLQEAPSISTPEVVEDANQPKYLMLRQHLMTWLKGSGLGGTAGEFNPLGGDNQDCNHLSSTEIAT